jgi:outer membrane lipoprotein-sorting protein
MQEIPKEFASQNVLAFFAGIASLEGDYKVTAAAGSLKLKPKKGVGDLTIKVDEQNLIKAIELKDATGNVSSIRLKNYRFDQGLKAALFKQQPPQAARP